MRRGRLLLVAVALSVTTGCTTDDRDDFFLFVVLFCFGAAASLGSVIGSGFALAQVAQRKPRGYVNLALAVPCAIAAVVLDAFAVSFSSGGHGVDQHDFFLIAMTATPLCWLAATVMSVVLRSPAQALPEMAMPYPYRDGLPPAGPAPTAHMTATRIVSAIVPPLCVLLLYFAVLYFALPEHIPAVAAP